MVIWGVQVCYVTKLIQEMPHPYSPDGPQVALPSKSIGAKFDRGMLDQGIVEPAEGARSSPIVLAKKKNGSTGFALISVM